MASDLPPPNWLRAFEVTARHLSFTQAAAELGLTQAAVSKRVRLLEQHLSEPLFVRKTRSLLLTKSGEAFLPKVRDAFNRLEEGTREVFGARQSNVLTIRSTVAFSVNWLGPRLGAFQRQYPDIVLRIISSVWDEGDGGRGFDLDVRYGTEKSLRRQLQPTGQRMRLDRLTWDSIMPVCAPCLVDEGHIASIDDLANFPRVHVLGYLEGWERWLDAKGAKGARSGGQVQVDTSLFAFEMAARGDGVAMARSSLAQVDLDRGRLAAPFEEPVPIEEAFYLVDGAKTSDVEREEVELFRDWLLEEAEKINRKVS